MELTDQLVAEFAELQFVCQSWCWNQNDEIECLGRKLLVDMMNFRRTIMDVDNKVLDLQIACKNIGFFIDINGFQVQIKRRFMWKTDVVFVCEFLPEENKFMSNGVLMTVDEIIEVVKKM